MILFSKICSERQRSPAILYYLTSSPHLQKKFYKCYLRMLGKKLNADVNIAGSLCCLEVKDTILFSNLLKRKLIRGKKKWMTIKINLELHFLLQRGGPFIYKEEVLSGKTKRLNLILFHSKHDFKIRKPSYSF